MQKSDSTAAVKTTRRQVKSSTTLNRRYVTKPIRKSTSAGTVRRSPKIQHFNSSMPQSQQVQGIASSSKRVQPKTLNIQQPQRGRMVSSQSRMAKLTPTVEPHPMQVSANTQIRARKQIPMSASSNGLISGITAKQMKEQAIQKALASSSATDTIQDDSAKAKTKLKMRFSLGRVLLALTCATIAVLAIVYFVNLNMPDVSLRVAAIQTGIEASYPSHIPQGFVLSDIVSEEGKISLGFNNSSSDQSFILVEEKSSWDSGALLTNYVKPEYSDDYSIIREQGLTIYVDGSNASWVNGGIVYKITADNGVLTKKQIKNIATSL